MLYHPWQQLLLENSVLTFQNSHLEFLDWEAQSAIGHQDLQRHHFYPYHRYELIIDNPQKQIQETFLFF